MAHRFRGEIDPETGLRIRSDLNERFRALEEGDDNDNDQDDEEMMKLAESNSYKMKMLFQGEEDVNEKRE